MLEPMDRPASRLAAALAGGGTEESRARRADGDFFPTPPDVIEALVRAEPWLRPGPDNGRVCWEPSCGEGAIARRLEAEGWSVVATDIKDRGYGIGGVDFLTCPYPDAGFVTGVPAFDGGKRLAAIVMNPPFNQAAHHLRRALDLRRRGYVGRIACLLGGEFWTRKKHLRLFAEDPPATVMPLAWKPDFTGGGSGIFTVQWCVWDAPVRAWTLFKPLPRPVMDGQADLLDTEDGDA